jgi:ribonuclease D
LTEILQGVRLEKAYTRLDWTTRPLPDGAIEYALDDVRYLKFQSNFDKIFVH